MTDASAPRKRPQAQAQAQSGTPSAAPASPSGQPAAAATPEAAHTKARRGFAVMDKSRQREIASAGGRAAHARGNAHEFTPDEAREAGRKGGRSVSSNKDHMADIGRKGGIERGRRHAIRAAQKKASPAPHGDAAFKTPRRPHAESAQAAG